MFLRLFSVFLLLSLGAIDLTISPTKDLVKDDNGNVQLGWVTLLNKNKIVVFPATYIAAVDDELEELEVLISSEWGRIHESLFKTKTSPLHLSVLLSLAGLKKGDLVDIKVATIGNKSKEFFIEELLYDKRNKKMKEKVGWKFIADEKYMRDAQIGGNIALLYSITDATVIDCNDRQSKEDWIFSVNKINNKLKVNQEVMLIISKRKKSK